MSGMSRSFTLETVPEAAEGDTLARCCFYLFKNYHSYLQANFPQPRPQLDLASKGWPVLAL